MTTAVLNDPTSSWGESAKHVNASGDRFAVKYMGYAPILQTIRERPIADRDALVRHCINTVVSSRATHEYSVIQHEGVVGPYVSVYQLDLFLNISSFTITCFHIQDGRTHLLGRYKNNQISHYKYREIDGRHYLGIVMKIGRTEKRECNVFMLDNDIALNDLTTKLRSVDERRHNNALQLETRLRSTQEYRYTPNMLACYHGPLSHEDACRQLVLPGEFIIRDSSMRGEFAVSYKTSHGPHDKSIVPNNNIDFFRRFQVDQSVLKHPVVRRQE